jgi:endonuclease YncB( thermonuclease family)
VFEGLSGEFATPSRRDDNRPDVAKPVPRSRLTIHVVLWTAALATMSAAPFLWDLIGGHRTGPPDVLTGLAVHVVDGDTITVQLGGRIEKVRYGGINAPEVAHFMRDEERGAGDASALNRRLVEGKTVRLELDLQERDRSGRLLAYVYVGETMVNAELVRLGYAQVQITPPNVRYQALFLALQREAQEQRRGLWAH